MRELWLKMLFDNRNIKANGLLLWTTTIVLFGCSNNLTEPQENISPILNERVQSSHIEQPPNIVIPYILSTLRNNQYNSQNDAGAHFRDRPKTLVNGKAIGTRTVTTVKRCNDIRSNYPQEIWSYFCADGITFRQVAYLGIPELLVANAEFYRKNSKALTRYRYSEGLMKSDLDKYSIDTIDVTDLYDDNWSGHFPYSNTVLVFKNADGSFSILLTDNQGNANLSIYSSEKRMK